ncbi:MAG: FAD-dependent oxidoreductase [Gammaproteobacteria bacterium]|nr:FAD-dependent oxidoreductase [Gammaproteobacteria bacterium]
MVRTTTGRRRFIQGLGAAMLLPTTLQSCRGGLGGGLDADVIVIGAGMAGLYAATLLEESGARVLVLEGSNRVGGRVYTKFHAPGPIEVGGSEILPDYARLLYLAERHNLELAHEHFGQDYEYHIDGIAYSHDEWSSSPQSRHLTAREREVRPSRLGSVFPLPEHVIEQGEHWLDPEMHKYDFPYSHFLLSRGISQRALELMSTPAASGTTPDEMSVLFMLRNQMRARQRRAAGHPRGYWHMVDGLGNLPQAMANNLHESVVMQQIVTAITAASDRVVVSCKNGRKYRAEYVVSTLPTTTLRDVDITPALPPLQAAAVEALTYRQSTALYFQVLEPYWEVDGRPPAMWSTGPVAKVMHRVNAHHDYIWLNLPAAADRALAQHSMDDLIEYVKTELYKMRPSMRGRVEFIGAQSWSRNPFSVGVSAFRRPGQISRYGDVYARPHGRVHFAGEHTGDMSSGLEGALESGERSAMEILARL